VRNAVRAAARRGRREPSSTDSASERRHSGVSSDAIDARSPGVQCVSPWLIEAIGELQSVEFTSGKLAERLSCGSIAKSTSAAAGGRAVIAGTCRRGTWLASCGRLKRTLHQRTSRYLPHAQRAEPICHS